jgi:PAS domain-containing protein
VNAPIPALTSASRLLPRHDHVVQFYEDDAWLLDQLADHFLPALRAGQAMIMVGSKLHREGLKLRLKRRGFDLRAAVREGRYVERDADETLARFMRRDRVDNSRFHEVIGGLIRAAQADNTREVVVFGEMVALLWFDGKRSAALYLEQLWNGLIADTGIHLVCAYPMTGFSRAAHEALLSCICAEHTHVVPAETYTALSEKQRGAAVTQLQQRAQALETEVRIAEERAALIQAAAGLGTWELDLTDDSIALSSNAQRLLGIAAAQRVVLPDLLRVMSCSGDRDAFAAALKRARTGRKEFSAEFRVNHGHEVRVLTSEGRLYYNNGQPILIAVLRDATASRQEAAA